MPNQEISESQVWKRADGREVKIGRSRIFRGTQEYELIPLGKGRKSWKWYGGIRNHLEFVRGE